MTSFNLAKQAVRLLALWLALLSLPALANTPAATVLFSHGTVTVTNVAGGHDLNKGDGVNAGDTIHTGGDGRIQMRFSDGGLVSLRPNSAFAVDKYNQPTSTSEGSVAFNLIKGGLRTLSGSIGHKDHANYQLKTSVATLGIRGTQFLVTMDGQTMRVHVGHGQISLENQFGQLLVSAGQNGQVTFGNAPELSLIVPEFGDSSDDQKKDKRKHFDLSDESLKKALLVKFLLGKDADTLLNGGIALATVSSLSYGTGSSEPDSNLPQSISLTGFQLALIKQIAENKGVDTSGWLDGVNLDNPSASVPDGTTVNVTNGLVWGELTASAPQSDTSQFPTSDPAYMAYVIGKPATDIPLTGTMYYSLVAGAATPVRNEFGGSTQTLKDFDLTIHFDLNPTFEARVGLFDSSTGGYNSYLTTDAPAPGTMNGAAFNFAAGAGTSVGVSNEGSSCANCSLNVAGILSGNGATSAGVTYRAVDGQGVANTGSAVLQTVPSLPPSPGF